MSKFKLLVQKLKLNEDELKLLNAYLFSLTGMLAVPDKNEIHIDYIIRLQNVRKISLVILEFLGISEYQKFSNYVLTIKIENGEIDHMLSPPKDC